MQNEAEFCRNQAIRQKDAAAGATLANVREQCERAAAAWDVMAARSEQTARQKAERDARASPPPL